VSAASDDKADDFSEKLVLEFFQPFRNHNGGTIMFGPNDGYLYISSGDGGAANDPQDNAQDLNSLLGKILRIKVDALPYKVPDTNPFAKTSGARDEIWAYGLRNPWKFRFDRDTSDMFIGDVGQNTWEEIDFQPSSSGGGENYGWVLFEGPECIQGGENCEASTTFVPPIISYRNQGQTCSVTGGHMYRGSDINGLQGTYIYGDFCSGEIWGATKSGGVWNSRLLYEAGFSIPTFGEDGDGELYVADYYSGVIYKFVPA
jgi:glucose/arabinose dehydrogenase